MPSVSGALHTLRGGIGKLVRLLRGRDARRSTIEDPRVELLMATPLFDDAWYALCLDRRMDRRAAVEHYLRTGREKGMSPHPLFVPKFAAEQMGTVVDVDHPIGGSEPAEIEDPLVTYVQDRRFDVDVHPLFEVARYTEAYPEALGHEDGPIGHYLAVGAVENVVVNSWYQPDSAREPRGIVDWIWADACQWVARRRVGLPTWSRVPVRATADDPPGRHVSSEPRTTTVVLVAEHPDADLVTSVRSVLGQTISAWELIVVGVGDSIAEQMSSVQDDPRIRVEWAPAATPWAARNAGLAASRGEFVAWMSAGEEWLPGRLKSLHAALAESGRDWAHDCVREVRTIGPQRFTSRAITRASLLTGAGFELGAVIVAKPVAAAIGGFDESLTCGRALDFLLRLTDISDPAFVPTVGLIVKQGRYRAWRPRANERPWVNYERIRSSTDAVLNSHLIDWSDLASRSVDPGLVSVIIPTYDDFEMTTLAVRRVVENREAGLDVEVIVVDNGCGAVASGVLGSLPHQFEGTRLVRAPVNYGFALGNNLALREARGATVVFLNNDTEVQPGWLDPLVESLDDPSVLGAQALLLYPDGSVQSAGVVFPRGGGLPHVLLQGFPPEDAHGLERYPFNALTGAALAMRYGDVVELRGFDPLFRNGMEDVDICLRLAKSRAGRFVVRPDSRVIHHESRTPGRFERAVINRKVLLDRWAGNLPEDDVRAWRDRGYDVIGHQIRGLVSPDRRLCVAEPVLARSPRLQVSEGRPRLRWAIKNPAPYGAEGEKWGDTHFARQLRSALTELGQDVVIDNRPAFERPSEYLDDVVLLLRGIAPYTPVLDRVNLLWLISHPDMVERGEYIGWDRIYVASESFARVMADQWGAPAVPLLQATDPSRFHPALAEPDGGDRVLFIGNSRRQSRPLVVWAATKQLPLSVYGSGWDGLIPDRYIRGTFVPNEEVGAAYRSAGVVLNDHWSDMARNGFLSNRLFDAVAAGARVISDDVVGVHEVFGGGVQVVSGAEELASIVNAPDLDAIFGSDEVRRARAARIAAEHSFAVRAQTLVDDALRIRSHRNLG